jgi:hypothetical protein
MKTRQLLSLLVLAGVAAASLSCAPVDTPVPDLEQGKRPPSDSGSERTDLPFPTPGTASSQPLAGAAARDPLEQRIDAAIEQVKRRDLLTTNGFWTVFHGILGLGPTVSLLNPDTGQRVNALDYVFGGGKVRGMRFVPTADGLDVETRPGTFISQGHQDQFVAEMVQWGVAPERKVLVDGQEYSFRDFLRHSKARASLQTPQELEWALVIIGTHYGADAHWQNAAGEKLHFTDLVKQELDKPLDKAACGGTHRLFGLSWVYHLHLRHGGQTEGVWQVLAEQTTAYQRRARELQNPDGSFSTEFFRGRGQAPDPQLRMNTTGHIFEWLALSLTDDALHEPWVRDAANALALMFLDMQDQPMEGGTMYHAIHGLLIYSSRLYGAAKLGPLAPPVVLPPPRAGALRPASGSGREGPPLSR